MNATASRKHDGSAAGAHIEGDEEDDERIRRQLKALGYLA